MDNERDRRLKAMYGLPEIVVGSEDEPPETSGRMPVYLKVDFEEAREAEGWFGIYQDLGFVVSAATRAAELKELRYGPEAEGKEPNPPVNQDDIVEQSL